MDNKCQNINGELNGFYFLAFHQQVYGEEEVREDIGRGKEIMQSVKTGEEERMHENIGSKENHIVAWGKKRKGSSMRNEWEGSYKSWKKARSGMNGIS